MVRRDDARHRGRLLLGRSVAGVSVTGRLQRFGNQAQVRLVGDTAFVAEFGSGWKIVAVLVGYLVVVLLAALAAQAFAGVAEYS